MSVSRLGSVLGQIDVLFRDGTLCGLSDRELVDRFRERSERSEAAFAGLVERHSPMVLRVCRSVLSNPSDVDDAFQATFLVLVRRVGSVWVRDSIGPWLYNVANRVALRSRADAIRRKSREEGSATREHFLVEEGQDRSERSETARLVHEELARLPERRRGPIVLCHLEGMTHEQASRSLGVPVGTVRSRLSRGRERLKDRLIRRGLAPAVAWAASGIGIGGEGSAAVVSGSLVQKTVSAGLGLASGWSLAGPVSVSTFQLTQGVLMSMFLTKAKTAALIFAIGGTTMGVSMKAGGFGIGEQVAVPATEGDKPAADTAPAEAPPVPRVPVAPAADRSRGPLLSTVQIQINGARDVKFAAGTVIFSTPGESIILTCAHVFMLDGLPQPVPSEFPKQTLVNILGEELARDSTAKEPPKLSFIVGVNGEVIAYDLKSDLALVRISPQENLRPPASPLVPSNWKVLGGMKMLSVGFSDSNLRTVTARITKIVTPKIRGLSGNMDYEGIECDKAPKQGMFGGGLFTDDGYLAGVCNFAEPEGNHGFYATPHSIQQFLDRNGLKKLYHRPEGQVSNQPKLAADPEYGPYYTPLNPVGPLEKPAANPVPIPKAKTPADEFDNWLKEAKKDLGPSDQTLNELKTLLKEIEEREQVLNAEMQRLQKTKREVTAMLHQAKQPKKPILATPSAPNDSLSPFDLDHVEANKPSSPPSVVPDARPKSPFDLDPVEAKKPSSPDVEGRLKDVEQKLERILKSLEKTNASPKDGQTPPPIDSNPDSPSS